MCRSYGAMIDSLALNKGADLAVSSALNYETVAINLIKQDFINPVSLLKK